MSKTDKEIKIKFYEILTRAKTIGAYDPIEPHQIKELRRLNAQLEILNWVRYGA